jgi:hypothetical protein
MAKSGTAWHGAARGCGAAGWLGLAASPSFALMAWLAAGDIPPMPLCGAGAGMAGLGGMTGMYLLMSLFHASPWLQLAAGCLRRLTDPAAQTGGD